MQKLHRCASQEMLWLPWWFSIGFKIPCRELPSPPTCSCVWVAMGRGYFWHKGQAATLCKPVPLLSGHLWIIYVAGQILWILWLFLAGQLGSEGCSVNSNVSGLFYFLPFCKEKIHYRPCMTGLHHCSRASPWDVPKSSKALDNKSLGRIGWRLCEKHVYGVHALS